MRLINKLPQPTLFQQYIRQVGTSYEDMDTDVKNELKQSLIKEQHGVCVYCQQTLKKEEQVTIEHHCERSICNGQDGTIDKRLDYSNLFAVCIGKGGLRNDLHCDTKKATFNATNGLPISINPTNSTHIKTIKYSSTGLISSSNDLYNKEIDEILNLNINYLKDLRKRKWMLIFKQCHKNKNVNVKKMRKLLEFDLLKKDGKFQNSFPALSDYMKNKFC